MQALLASTISVCASIECLPDSLDVFVHTCTPLPCALFLTECPHEPTRVEWYTTLMVVLDPDVHADRHRQKLQSLRQQLETTMHTSVVLLSTNGVHPICDPERTRYMQELVSGAHVYRTHIENLIRQEVDSRAAEQTRYMLEDLLATFPPNGLQAVSTSELIAMFLQALRQ